jgi:hypothetical protein
MGGGEQVPAAENRVALFAKTLYASHLRTGA